MSRMHLSKISKKQAREVGGAAQTAERRFTTKNGRRTCLCWQTLALMARIPLLPSAPSATEWPPLRSASWGFQLLALSRRLRPLPQSGRLAREQLFQGWLRVLVRYKEAEERRARPRATHEHAHVDAASAPMRRQEQRCARLVARPVSARDPSSASTRACSCRSMRMLLR